MNDPASLYVHLPWCVSKCPYCDFNSRVIGDGESALPGSRVDRYTDAIIRDLHYELGQWQGRSFASVFFGGGTPSLFPAEHIARILREVESFCTLDAEITLEANPDSADVARFRGYRAIGVNRISIGVQSFCDAALQKLGRAHDGDGAMRAFAAAREAGFDNINLDLMYALPEQGTQQAMQDLQQAIDLKPEHISWYQLTMEENTVFAAMPPHGLPDEQQIVQMEQQGYTLLDQSGYHRYEISAFCKPDRQCAHNLNYWNFGDYMGVGAGAHGKLSKLAPLAQSVVRTSRVAHPEHYMQHAGTAAAVTERRLQHRDLLVEFALNALRLCDGFSVRQFTNATALDAAALREPLDAAMQQGLLSERQQIVKPTAMGLRFMNETLAIFNDC